MTIRNVVKHRDYFSKPGERFRKTYKIDDSDGIEKLVEDGCIDLKEEIQSHEQSVNIDSILARYRLGDTSVLDDKGSFYGDITEMPSSLQEFYELDNNARNAFNKLPVEVKEAYGNNYRNMLNDEYIFNSSQKEIVTKEQNEYSTDSVKDVENDNS